MPGTDFCLRSARAARTVGEHRADCGAEWEAMTSIAARIGCAAETLRRWCREVERRQTRSAEAPGTRGQGTAARANEILRKASAYFAMAGLDRRDR